MQLQQMMALVHDHQQELRQAIQPARIDGVVGAETPAVEPRPLPLRLVDRLLGPH